MRILTWNVSLNVHKKSRLLDNDTENRPSKIMERIEGCNADVIVLTEFQIIQGQEIINKLSEKYWWKCACENQNTNNRWIVILLAVKKEFIDCEIDKRLDERKNDLTHFRGRTWLGIEIKSEKTKSFKDGKLKVLGIHVPNIHDKRREPFWEAIYEEVNKDEDKIIVGDFNAYYSKDAEEIDSEIATELKRIVEIEDKWIDAWEAAHKNKLAKDIDRYTHYIEVRNRDRFTAKACPSVALGRRLDYAFLSPGLEKRLICAEHLHDVRISGLSDHSALIIEISDIP